MYSICHLEILLNASYHYKIRHVLYYFMVVIVRIYVYSGICSKEIRKSVYTCELGF